MKISYFPFCTELASVRLRCVIPMQEMKKQGVQIGAGGTFIASKHSFYWKDLPKHRKLVYDVCDDHFNDHLSEHYRYGCEIADAITCNSTVMQEIILKETGRESTIIPEPYESEEREPSLGYKLLWFGHKSNLVDIERLLPDLKQPITILTNFDEYPEWNPASFSEQMARDCLVVIPTGKSMAKSENRMVESIRNGKYVCSEFLPAYIPFYEFFQPGSIPAQIDRVLANPGDSLNSIRLAQDYIRDRYSPSTIASQWINLFETL